jgi:phenylalanyl-tRNA synthetase beta chain
VERDIAVIVKDSVTHAQLMAAVHAAKTQGLLRNAVLFDVYRPKVESAAMAMDEKSLAVRLTLNSDEATLNEAQIEGVVQAVLAELAAQVSARLRA